jgi:very-short-patch-repair endonuclease
MCAEEIRGGSVLRTCGDRAAAELAGRQGAAISTGQLRAVGLGTGAIKLRLRRGRLHPVHRSVYAWGVPRLGPVGLRWAAVLATGGVLSHRTAAAMWDLIGWPAGAIDVTTLRSAHSRPGIRVHRGHLMPHEITTLDGLPVTTPMRALFDLAGDLNDFRHERAVHRAAELHLLDASYDPAGRPGAARLRAAMATLKSTAPRITKSDMEERFLKLVHDHGLPPPLTNVIVNSHEVDAYWPHARLIVELDSHRHHDNPTAFEGDRAKDQDHVLAGDRVIRLTWGQLTPRTAERLRTLLAT